MSDDQPGFRIRAWPGLQLPVPPPVFGGVTFDISGGLLSADKQELHAWVSLDSIEERRRLSDPIAQVGEIYLELARVPLEDEAAILEFCKRFGITGVRWANSLLFRDIPGFEEITQPELQAAWSAEDANRSWSRESLADFRFGARCVRDLVRALNILSGQDDELQWESLPPGMDWVEGKPSATRYHQANFAIPRLTTRALSDLHPRLHQAPDVEPHDIEWELSGISLYSICCIEAYNHVVEQATYKRCHNETCGKLFVRQHGRAVKGQHRSHGVEYCSYYCARAQSQRVYSRRKRAAQREATGT